MAGTRHRWYEAESEEDPVLGEIVPIWRQGVADLASRRRVDIPHITQAARMLLEEQPERQSSDLVATLLNHILHENNPKWIHGEQRRDAAIALFGLDDQTYGRGLSSRRQEAAHRCNQAAETFRRPERGGMEALLLRAVASAITGVIESQSKPGPTSEATGLSLSTAIAGQLGPVSYVRRPSLERQLLDLLDTRQPLIAVAGPPSVGKRTLVEQTLSDRVGVSRVLRISGDSPENAQRTMFDALVASGVSLDEISVIPQYNLRKLLRSERSPEILVIENVSSAELPQFLMSGGARATVIVTASRRLHGIDPSCYVEVGNLELGEAVELVNKLLPAATQDDAEMLAQSIDCHVLAVTTACGMIRESPGVSVTDFCRGLRQDIAAVFDGNDDSQYPALTQIYRKTLADLERLDPQACRVLELAAFLYEADAFSAFLVFALGSILNISPNNESHLKIIAGRAARVLRDRYLVEVNDRSCITMPRLARTIITHLVHDRGPDICQHLRQGILRIVELSRKAWPDMPLGQFLEKHQLTLLHLTNTHIDPLKTGGPIDYMAVYAQGVADLLRRIDEPAWRVMIIAVETSTESFGLMLQVLPRKLEDVSRPVVFFSWRDSEEHHVEYAIPNWETRKAMQLLLISRSDNSIQEIQHAISSSAQKPRCAQADAGTGH